MKSKFLFKILDWTSYKYPALFFNDKKFIILRWRCQNRDAYDLTLDYPVTFNEKLNWLKLNDHNPIYNILADKYEVKKYVSKIIGSEYIVPCYGVYNNFDEINFDTLPDKFVLKSTHDSSGALVCTSKAKFDIENAEIHFKHSLSRNWYWPNREWVYKNIPPRIIADKYLGDGSKKEIRDYKFWCFDGKPKYMYITNKGKEIHENFYDMQFVPQPINHGFSRMSPEFEKPAAFNKMVELATKLSQGIPFVRIDFFYVDGHIYFGEFTFYDWGGMRAFDSYEQDRALGDLINL